jgi:hypothetical protein
MKHDKNDSDYFVMDTMTNLAQQASIKALLELCVILADRAGLQEVEGLPLLDWFHKRKVENVENLMISMEDKNPALAAKLQRALDDFKKETGI